jgi:16S rRNA (cytosine967-C5)-methyltransferase
VNAVLRRLAGGGEPPLPDAVADPRGWLESAGSLPPWLAARLVLELGAVEAVALGAALLERPPQTVRANRLRTTRDALRDALRQAFPDLEVTPTALAPEGLVLGGLADPGRTEAGEQGRLIVQDEGSQLVSHLLAPRPGERVLDLCAGRGGKTLHLAALLGSAAGLVAVDRFPDKLAGLLARARRGGCPEVRTVAADLTLPAPEVDALGPFDAVLLDAPCSGLGVLRRHPEAKWRIAGAELGDLVALQSALLDRAAGWVRPGGRLVYAVCTFTAEEGEGQVAAFLARRPDFTRAPLPASGPVPFADLGEGGLVRLWPHRHGCDGFTLASLHRTC